VEYLDKLVSMGRILNQKDKKSFFWLKKLNKISPLWVYEKAQYVRLMVKLK